MVSGEDISNHGAHSKNSVKKGTELYAVAACNPTVYIFTEFIIELMVHPSEIYTILL